MYISSFGLGKVNVGIEVANQLAVALGKRLSWKTRDMGFFVGVYDTTPNRLDEANQIS